MDGMTVIILMVGCNVVDLREDLLIWYMATLIGFMDQRVRAV